MIAQLVFAELRHRPGRALFLLAGYAFGVAVMVVLLAVGEAMLSQARNSDLLGGGDVLVLPAGINAEMIRGGGATSLFLGIDQARFVHRQILESPRGREEFGIIAASPILDGRAVEITAGGRRVQAIASGEIPSRAESAGAFPALLAGSWSDSPADRGWAYPSPDELLHEIDRFHLPYGTAAGDSTWAEWHYFNVSLGPDSWLYLTYLIGGRVGVPGEWGGRLLLTVRDPGGAHTNYSRDVTSEGIAFDTTRADLTLDEAATVRVIDGVYHLRADVDGNAVDVRIRPDPNHFFPPASLGGPETISGYVVPALAATAEGEVCLASGCVALEGARAYHDHNWGVWRDVGWEWGAASDGEVSLLYGAVRGPGIPDQGLFAYLVDDRGVRGLFRPEGIQLLGGRSVSVGEDLVEVPSALRFEDRRRGLSVDVAVEDFQITDMERPTDRYFVQMSGVATVREAGAEPRELRGFFETYVE